MSIDAKMPWHLQAGLKWLPVATLLLSLLAAVTGGWQLDTHQNAVVGQRLNELSEDAIHQLKERLRIYELGLYATRGAVIAAGAIDRAHFRDYALSVDLDRAFPGARGFALVRRIGAGQEHAFAEQLRREGVEISGVRQFAAHDGDRFVVAYIEPEARNRGAVGLDIASEPVRSTAIWRSIASGEARLSAPLTLSQAAEQSYQGLLFMVPLFRDPRPPGDEAARRRSATGIVNMPIVIGEMMADFNFQDDSYALRLADVGDGTETVLYTSRHAVPEGTTGWTHSREISLYGRSWRVEVQPLPKLAERMNLHSPARLAVAIAVLGILLSTSLFFYLLSERRRRHSLLQKEQAQINRQLESLVAERTAMLNGILESASVGIVMIRDGRMLHVNSRMCRIFGYERDALLGADTGVLQLDDPGDGRTEAERESALAGGAVYRTELRMRRRDGSLVWIGLSGVAIDPGRSDAGSIWVFDDITRRKDVEAELQAEKSAAEQASESKSAFLANMSHEIRTPLNAITGMTYALRRSELTPQQVERVNAIDNAGRHLVEVISAVLDLSKVEAGKFDLESAPLRIASVFDNVASMLESKAAEKGLALHVEPPSLTHELRGDATRIQQCLINYVGNAIKFTERGSVTLRVREQARTDETLTLLFEVEDTGIGISPDVVPTLFGEFVQGNSTTTRRYGGTGLGLAITKKFAELMGGTAGVRSVVGEGSTFWFTATLLKGESTEIAGAGEHAVDAEGLLASRHAGKRILLADDEPINRLIAHELLEDTGLAIDMAHDGREAVEMAGATRYDLILMDMQMPVVDGLSATLQIRQLPQHALTPILAMTANAFAEDRARCLEAGMNDFIPKPIAPEELYAAVLKHLENSAHSA